MRGWKNQRVADMSAGYDLPPVQVTITRRCLRFVENGKDYPVAFSLSPEVELKAQPSEHPRGELLGQAGCFISAVVFLGLPMALFALHPAVWITLLSVAAGAAFIVLVFIWSMNRDSGSLQSVWHAVHRNPPATKPKGKTLRPAEVRFCQLIYHREHTGRVQDLVLQVEGVEYRLKRKAGHAYLAAGSPRHIYVLEEEYAARL